MIPHAYPEVLTTEEFDDIPWEHAEMFDNPRDAADYRREHGGAVYTQVDGDDGGIMYVLGTAIVNRTGVYQAVRLARDGGGHGTKRCAAAWCGRLCRRLKALAGLAGGQLRRFHNAGGRDRDICPRCLSHQFGYQPIRRSDPVLTADTFVLWICRNCNYQPFTDIRGLV